MKKILAVLLAALFVVSMSTMAFAVDVKSIEVKIDAKKEFTVGDDFKADGYAFTVKYDDDTTEDKVGTDAGFTYTPVKLEKAGKQVIQVSFGGKSTVIEVTVKEKPVETTTAAPTTAAPKLTLIEELNRVRTTFEGSEEDLAWAYAEVISRYAEDVDAITARQKLVQSSSLYPDNWNEFVKVFTDYVPTAVNQQLDIAARLGWDASDQDFVQDVIDLVKGAAESDKAADKAADNAASTDANPKTGSASAIAVFAVLSVAAAAVVCTKKKED